MADWHALTREKRTRAEIAANAIDNAADWIAAGVDPERSTLFIQSLVPEHAELYLLLQMVVPIPWLKRVPTYKEQREQLSEKDLSTAGFLGYPLLQTADVALYDGRFVPVGEDQVAHLELLARQSAAFTSSTERCSSNRSRCYVHAAAARAGQPQDEQELRQHHRSHGRR